MINIHAFFTVFLLAGTSLANATLSYTFTDLGTLGGTHSWAKGVNNAGQIVGYSSTTGGDTHATLWVNTTAIDLGTLGGSWAMGINNSGQIAGAATDRYGIYAMLWNTDTTAVVIPNSFAMAVNDAGQLAGSSTFSGNKHNHATLWNGTVATDLGTLGGRSSWANGINNYGQVVGDSDSITTGNTFNRATLWNGKTPIDLGTLGGTQSNALDINNIGQVVGGSWTTGDKSYHATLWSGNTSNDLGTLGGSTSLGIAINDVGQVVGHASTTGNAFQHATLWNGTTVIDLNIFLDASKVNEGWFLSLASGINDNGWIVGDAINQFTGDQHAFLLTPIPEPGIYILLFTGLGLLVVISRPRPRSTAP